MSESRPYDVVLLGASGFTGGLVAEHLARRGRQRPLEWAIAGRNADKLERVRERLDPEGPRPDVIDARIDDPDSLVAMASQARAVLTTVGPYAELGEPVVRACIEAGAHYADITGEPSFVARILDGYDERARERGLRIVSCCGFDSVPHDLGVMLATRQLPQDQRITCEGFVRARGHFSGGTWNSALNAFGELRGMQSAPRTHAPDEIREARGIRPRVHWEPRVDAWAVPMPTIDPLIVLRSARVCEGYGSEFRYGHYARVKRLSTLVGGGLALGGLVALSQLGPTRELLGKLRPSGEGPSAEQREKGFFQVDLFASAPGGHEAHVRVSGGDPGYGDTAKMCGESVLSLALDADRLPDRAGVLTPAAAMGDALLDRLRDVGIRFEVVG